MLESGSDRIGALDFQDSPTRYVPRIGSATLEQLMNAAAELEAGHTLPAPLAEALTRGTSIGGARPKALLADVSRSLIAKFSSTTDIRPVVKAEGVAMELACRAGLDVAPVEVVSVAGKDVLLVERFDRPGGQRRRHMVSSMTILGLDEFTGARYGSYALLADQIRRTFTTPEATLRELFSRIVFNVLVGNTDDHPRNHAAFVNADGTLSLTPAYDICPQPRSVPQASQAMAIGRNGERASQIRTCMDSCEVYLLDRGDARAIIDAQIDVIKTHWDEAADAARLRPWTGGCSTAGRSSTSSRSATSRVLLARDRKPPSGLSCGAVGEARRRGRRTGRRTRHPLPSRASCISTGKPRQPARPWRRRATARPSPQGRYAYHRP